MKTTRHPNAWISLLWALCALTLFAFLQLAESRAVSNDGPLSFSHLDARAEEAASLYFDDTSEWNATSAENDLLSRRGVIEKRTLRFIRNGKKIKITEVDFPTTQQVKEEIIVGQKRANLEDGKDKNILFFYANLGLGDADPRNVLAQYLQCDAALALFPERKAVGYVNVVEQQGFMASLKSNLENKGRKGDLLVPRIVSQAFAEECSGKVYLFTRGDQEPGEGWRNPYDLTWLGWEYPALTRNENVEEIIRIDPRPGEDHTPRVIWTKKDPKSENEPRGADETVTNDRV